MSRVDVFRRVKRRARSAALPPSVCCPTFRATGITAYLGNGGIIKRAQRIAATSARATKLYDRTDRDLISTESPHMKAMAVGGLFIP